MNQITKGDFVVTQVLKWDEENSKVYFWQMDENRAEIPISDISTLLITMVVTLIYLRLKMLIIPFRLPQTENIL